MGALKLLPILSAKEEGRRLKQVRRHGVLKQADLSEALDFRAGTSSNVSKIEAGEKRIKNDYLRRQVANLFARHPA